MEKMWRYCHLCQKALWVPEDNRITPACPECGDDTVATYTRTPNQVGPASPRKEHNVMEHTPGPWRLDHQNVLDNDGGTVALITNPLHGNGEVMDWPAVLPEERTTAASLSAEANAKLITAAPDLLKALEEIYDASRDPYTERRARAAIKLAKGN